MRLALVYQLVAIVVLMLVLEIVAGYVWAAQTNALAGAEVARVAPHHAAILVVVVAMAVATHVILSVLAAQLLAVGGVPLSAKDAPLHALPIVVTLAQMTVLVIVAQLVA